MGDKWISSFIILFSLGLVLGQSPINFTHCYAESVSDSLEITIAYTTDMHSHMWPKWDQGQCLGGLPSLATKVQELRMKRPVLLFDCGDIISGGAINDMNSGTPMVEAMNVIGYDAMVLDNHEFDPGVKVLEDMIDIAEFEMISANTEWDGDIQPVDYSIETIMGYNIGVIGATPSFWYAPEEVTFTNLNQALDNAIQELNSEGVDFIVSLGSYHSDVDVVIKGGGLSFDEHILITPYIGQYTSALGILNLTINTNDGSIDDYSFLERTLSSIQPNETIEDFIEGWEANMPENIDTPIGFTQVTLSRNDIGVVLSEALRVSTESDIGVYNYGGVRDDVDRGFITFRDLYHVEPFFNFISVIEAPGWIAENIINSNIASTNIENFETDSIYSIACSNFSATSLERSYGLEVTRQDFQDVSVIKTISEYIPTAFPVDGVELLSSLMLIKEDLQSLPDFVLTDDNPIEIRSNLVSKIDEIEDSMSVIQISSLISDIESSIKSRSYQRWLVIELNCLLHYLEPELIIDPVPLTGIALFVIILIILIIFRFKRRT